MDNRTIGVVVLDGRANNQCSITRVEEASTAIQIWAECPEFWLSTGSTGAAYRYEFTVELDDDLAARTIVDGNGDTAELCKLPGCF